MAKHDDVGALRRDVLVRQEEPAECGAGVEELEVRCADCGDFAFARFSPGPDGAGRGEERGELVE
jgi:hypothetical protein